MSSRLRTTKLVALLAMTAVLVFALGASAALAAPVIGALSPALTNDQLPTLSVDVSGNAVSAVTFTALGPGNSMTASNVGGGFWEYDMTVPPNFPLSIGTNTIVVSATDADGTTTDIRLVEVTLADITAPSSAATEMIADNVATITVAATDPDGIVPASGVDAIFYVLDGGPVTEYTGAIVIKKAGAHTFSHWAVDNAGNVEAPCDHEFTIVDTLKPVTTSNAAASYTAAASIALTATDTANGFVGLGVKNTFYKLDGGAVTTYTAAVSVPFSAPSTHTIEFWSVDNANNVEATKSATFTMANALDVTPPTSWSDAVPVYDGSAVIALNATDTAPGVVANTYYKLDGGATQTVTVPANVTVTTVGSHTLEFWSVDNSGNVENPHKFAAFTISLLDDTTAPTIISDVAAAYEGQAVIHLTATDPVVSGAVTSGVDHVHWKINGGTTNTGAGALATVTVTGAGSYTIEFWASDVAGNDTTPHLTGQFTIEGEVIPVGDTTPPSTISDAVASYEDTAVITLTSNDESSGIKSISYKLDDDATVTVNAVQATRVRATRLDLGLPNASKGHPGGQTLSNCKGCHASILPAGHSPAAPTSCGCHTVVVAATTLNVPADHAGRTTCKGCHPAAGVIMPTGHYGQTANFPGGGECPTCHVIAVASPPDETGTVVPGQITLSNGGKTGTLVLNIGGVGNHSLKFWATDNANNVETPKTATFEVTEENEPPVTHTVTSSTGANGTITPLGIQTVNDGENISFTVTANANFHIASVLVNGAPVTVPAGATTFNYTFTNVTANGTISATFAADVVEPVHVDSSVGIKTSAVTVKRGRSFILSGACMPSLDTVGYNVKVYVKKPGRATWSYSSFRTVYNNAGQASWWYRYTTLVSQPLGTYRFFAQLPAGANTARFWDMATSPQITVNVVR